MAKLTEVEGIGMEYANKLGMAGIKSTDDLLKMGATPKSRKELAAKAGISDKLILEWVNHVDLFRIKGVHEEYADLLEEAGVDTIVELANRKPSNLFEKLEMANAEKKLVRKLPTEEQVLNWVTQAKTLPRMIQY